MKTRLKIVWLKSAKTMQENVRTRLKILRLKSAITTHGNVRARIGTVKLKNVRAKCKNMRVQKSFSKNDKTKHLQLHLLGLYHNLVESDNKIEQ